MLVKFGKLIYQIWDWINLKYTTFNTSSQRQGTSQGVYANGWMRTDLNNSTFKLTPNLVNKTETKQ